MKPTIDWGWVLLGLALGCPSEPDAPAPPVVEAKKGVSSTWRFALDKRVTPYETFYHIHPQDADRPAWRWRETSRELRLGVELGALDEEQVAELAAMLAELKARLRVDLRRVDLIQAADAFSYPALGERLARLAQRDNAWRALLPRLGRDNPERGKLLSAYVVGVLRRGRLHPELDRMLAGVGRRARILGVEKCWTARPNGRGEGARWLKALGLGGEMPLPGGCASAIFELASTNPEAQAP